MLKSIRMQRINEIVLLGFEIKLLDNNKIR